MIMVLAWIWHTLVLALFGLIPAYLIKQLMIWGEWLFFGTTRPWLAQCCDWPSWLGLCLSMVAILMLFSITPLGTWLRKQHLSARVPTLEEAAYLMPLIKTVLTSASYHALKSINCRVYIIERDVPTILSLGYHSLFIPTVLLSQLTSGQLQAMVAQAVAYQSRGSSVHLSLVLGAMWISEGLEWILQRLMMVLQNSLLWRWMMWLLWYGKGLIWLIQRLNFIWCCILKLYQRYATYRADKLTVQFGYGGDLLASLEVMRPLAELTDKQNDRFWLPPIVERIDKLKLYLEKRLSSLPV